jgi:hypothetical protein
MRPTTSATISTASDSVMATTSLGTGFSAFHLAVNPATGTVYGGLTTSSGTGAVWALDGSTLAVMHTISLSDSFPGIDVDPATGTLYVTDQGWRLRSRRLHLPDRTDLRCGRGRRHGGQHGRHGPGRRELKRRRPQRLDRQGRHDRAGARLRLEWPRDCSRSGSRHHLRDGAGQFHGLDIAADPGASPRQRPAALPRRSRRTARTFSVTTTGSPTATVTVTGKLPAGLAFTRGLLETAVLAGSPAGRIGRLYRLTITATNGVAPAASARQAFTLTVHQAPSIASSRRPVFRDPAGAAVSSSSARDPPSLRSVRPAACRSASHPGFMATERPP